MDTTALRRHNLRSWIQRIHNGEQVRFATETAINQGELSALLKNKSFVIINSTLFTMMRYVSHNNFLISEQQLKKELTLMILAYLEQGASPNPL